MDVAFPASAMDPGFQKKKLPTAQHQVSDPGLSQPPEQVGGVVLAQLTEPSSVMQNLQVILHCGCRNNTAMKSI